MGSEDRTSYRRVRFQRLDGCYTVQIHYKGVLPGLERKLFRILRDLARNLRRDGTAEILDENRPGWPKFIYSLG